MRRSRRAAAAPGAPTHPQAPHPGYGSCRGMESSGPPPTPPPDLPTPLGNPGRPPTARPGFPQAPTAATTSINSERRQRKDDRIAGRWCRRRPLRPTMSPARRYAPTGWPTSVGMGGRIRRNAHPAPAKLPPTSRVPFEKTLVKVRALLIGWKVESGPGKDLDHHIVIADPQDKTKQMIVEVPSPACQGVCSSTFLAHFKQNRDLVANTLGQPLPNFQPLAKPWLVEITGPAFFDFDHGQIGLAPNCIEIHPVITIQFLSQTTSPVRANAATDLPHTCGTP